MKQLTKIRVNPDSVVPQANSVEEYRTDQERGAWGQFFEGKSPPIEYVVAGDIIGDIILGFPLIMRRYLRSAMTGVVICKDGIMHTSPIKSISQEGNVTYITTQNSVYKLEDYTAPSDDDNNTTTHV